MLSTVCCLLVVVSPWVSGLDYGTDGTLIETFKAPPPFYILQVATDGPLTRKFLILLLIYTAQTKELVISV